MFMTGPTTVKEVGWMEVSVVETTKEGYVNNKNLKVSTCILYHANHKY